MPWKLFIQETTLGRKILRLATGEFLWSKKIVILFCPHLKGKKIQKYTSTFPNNQSAFNNLMHSCQQYSPVDKSHVKLRDTLMALGSVSTINVKQWAKGKIPRQKPVKIKTYWGKLSPKLRRRIFPNYVDYVKANFSLQH